MADPYKHDWNPEDDPEFTSHWTPGWEKGERPPKPDQGPHDYFPTPSDQLGAFADPANEVEGTEQIHELRIGKLFAQVRSVERLRTNSGERWFTASWYNPGVGCGLSGCSLRGDTREDAIQAVTLTLMDNGFGL